MDRFHTDVYFNPKRIEESLNIVRTVHLSPSKHFLSNNRGIPFPSKKLLLSGRIFEYYLKDGEVIKFVIRCTLKESKYDVCYVVSNKGTIVTGWYNHRSDFHKTLNKKLYQRKGE